MNEWRLCRWHGTPAAAEAALRELGWYGPGEAPVLPRDPRIGGTIPQPGEPVRQVEGTAYVAVVASCPLEPPPGLADTEAELSTLLIGSF